MTAYGAVNSLRNTIDYILHSSHFSLVDPSPNIIQLAYEELNPLQEILERLDSTSTSRSRKKVNALDERIKELIWELEDILESLVYQQILSQFPADQVDEDDVGGEKIRFTIDLQFLQHHIPSFIERLEEMEEEYIYEVDNMPEDEDDDEVESISTRSGTKSKMIGLSDQFQHLKWSLTATSKQCFFAALVGTAGVGKTALAEAVFEDPEIISHFEHRIWVTVGRKSQFDDVSRDILAQMYGITQGDDELGAYLKERSEGMKCLIVLDDVWEEQILVNYDYVFRSSLMMLPHALQKLHLSGMGLSWKYMSVIGSLPNLEVLKLRAYAFRGSKWEEGSFLRLLFLLIEDSDLVQWKPRSRSFPYLVRLSMKHCYKLEEIHWSSRSGRGTIELVNCNPIALTCVRQLQPTQPTLFDVTASSSFDEKPTTIKFTRYWSGFE